MSIPFKTQFFSQPNISSSHIIDGTITNNDIALGTIDISNLSTACIASLSGGGGGLTENSVNSSHIIDGSILGTDICNNTITGSNIALETITSSNIALETITSSNIALETITSSNIADGAITEAKFAPELQTNLATFSYDLFNLMKPGWYGTFTIKNNNASNPNTITFSVEAHTYNPVTDSVDSGELLASTTLAHNQQEIITLGIHERLTNSDTIIKILYTLSSGNIDSTNETGVSIDSDTGSVYDLVVLLAFIHNGNIEFEVTIVV